MLHWIWQKKKEYLGEPISDGIPEISSVHFLSFLILMLAIKGLTGITMKLYVKCDMKAVMRKL